MIVLDTTILVYAKGAEHPLRDPCRSIIGAVAEGRVQATTTAEVIQEFVHVRARKWDRGEAADLGRAYADLLAPLLLVEERHLREGLRLFERYPVLGAFDAVLAATAIASDAQALVSADATFGGIAEIPHVDPGTPALDGVLQGPT